MTTSASRSERATSSERAPPFARSTARYALALLTAVYVVNFIDRQILSILIDPIKAELGVSDTAMGFLSGSAFALFYTFAGIPIARWADRGVRRDVIAVGLALWSGMTALSGVARSFAQLALARTGVGVGEAACSPAAHSLIADYFPREKRATAMAIYSTGIHAGILLGFVLGGWIREAFGWRAAFLCVGLPGLVLAVIVRLTLREPPRGWRDAATSASSDDAWSAQSGDVGVMNAGARSVSASTQATSSSVQPASASAPSMNPQLASIRAQPTSSSALQATASDRSNASFVAALGTLARMRTFRQMCIGGGLATLVGWAFLAWNASYLARVHGMSPGSIGTALGLVVGIGGAIGTLLGGTLADRGARHEVRWQLWVPAIGCMLALPCLALFTQASTPTIALVWLAPAQVSLVFWFGPLFGLTQTLVAPPMRALASSTFLFAINLIGLMLGPLIVGALNDAFEPRFGKAAIRMSLLCVCAFLPWAAAHLWLAARSLADDLAAVDAHDRR
jgi:predicted MFS family arabinose efflux permease